MVESRKKEGGGTHPFAPFSLLALPVFLFSEDDIFLGSRDVYYLVSSSKDHHTALYLFFSFFFFCRNDRKRKKGIWIKSYNISGKCLGFVKMHSEIGKETRSLNGPASCILACHTTSTSLSNFVFFVFW